MEGELLLSKVIIDGKLSKEFIYNDESELVRMIQYFSNKIQSESYFYNSLGQMEKKVQDNFVYSYFYNKKGLLESYTRSSKKN